MRRSPSMRIQPIVAVLLVAASTLFGCGGSTPTPPTTPSVQAEPLPFLFHRRVDYETLNYELWVLRPDPQTGMLAALSDTSLGRHVGPVAVHPTRPYVHVVMRTSQIGLDTVALRTYHVNTDGQLTRVAELEMPAATGVTQRLSFDATGQYLYLSGSANATMCALRADGSAALVTTDAFPGIRVDGLAAASRVAYVNTHGRSASGLHVFALDSGSGLPATGSALQMIPALIWSDDLVVSPPSAANRLLLTIAPADTDGAQLGLQPYRIEPATGLLRPIAGGPFFTDVSQVSYPGTDYAMTRPLVVTVHPGGRFVYVGERVDGFVRLRSHTHDEPVASLLAGYRYDAEAGAFKRVPGAPVVEDIPRGFSASTIHVSRDGGFLYTGASDWGPYPHLLGYRVDTQTGALTPLAEPAFTFPREGYF
jgi:hypothetical protein